MLFPKCPILNILENPCPKLNFKDNLGEPGIFYANRRIYS